MPVLLRISQPVYARGLRSLLLRQHIERIRNLEEKRRFRFADESSCFLAAFFSFMIQKHGSHPATHLPQV